jgi:hypothetical protein
VGIDKRKAERYNGHMTYKTLSVGMAFYDKYTQEIGKITGFHLVISRPFGTMTQMIKGELEDGTVIDMPFSMFKSRFKITVKT